MEDKTEREASLELTKTTDLAVNGISGTTLIDTKDKNGLIDSKSATGKRGTKRESKPILGIAKAEHRYKMWLRGELVGVAVVVIIVWALFLLPIIVYHLPVGGSPSNDSITVGETCSSVISYDGTVCRQELSVLANCFPDTEQDGIVRIQSDRSETFRPLLDALNAFASDDCKAAALPFLCVYFFGLCDSTGKAYRPSSSQCTEISTGVCASEWALASNFPGVILPECSSFPNETMLTGSCDSNAGSARGDTQTDMPNPTEFSETLNQTCTCREGFYCKNGSNLQCFPECGSWKQYSNTESNIIDAAMIVAVVIGIVSAIAVLTIAGVRWKKVFTFPSMFVVYETITLLILALLVLVTYFDRTGLYCSSRDLEDSLLNAAPFCVISGMAFYYIIIQLSVWWVVHVTSLLWKIRFPFHARRFESAHRVRYIHITCVIVGLLVPLLPVIVTIADSAVDARKNPDTEQTGTLGFSLTRSPPILCTGIDRTATYYSLALPLNLILIVGMTELVVIFWLIHKQHGLFKVKQSKNPFKIGTAERKILIGFCYYVLAAIISLIAFTISTRNGDQYANEVLKYFLCERSNPSEPCSRDGYEALSYPALTSLSYILLGLFPVINLTYVINFQELKEKSSDWVICLRLRKGQQTQDTIASFVSDGPSSTSTGRGSYSIKRRDT